MPVLSVHEGCRLTRSMDPCVYVVQHHRCGACDPAVSACTITQLAVSREPLVGALQRGAGRHWRHRQPSPALHAAVGAGVCSRALLSHTCSYRSGTVDSRLAQTLTWRQRAPHRGQQQPRQLPGSCSTSCALFPAAICEPQAECLEPFVQFVQFAMWKGAGCTWVLEEESMQLLARPAS